MDASRIMQRTTTGDVTTGSAYLRSVVLTGGSDAATAVIKAGGSGGTTMLTLAAATGVVAASGDLHNALCSGGIHVTLTGTGPSVTVVYA